MGYPLWRLLTGKAESRRRVRTGDGGGGGDRWEKERTYK